MWVRIKVLLIPVWPTVYNFINGSLYFALRVIRTMYKIAVKQIKGDYD